MMCQDIYGIFQKQAIQKLVAKENLELKKVKPMWFDSFYVSLLSEKYKTGKMNFIKGFFYRFYFKLFWNLQKRVFFTHLHHKKHLNIILNLF